MSHQVPTMNVDNFPDGGAVYPGPTIFLNPEASQGLHLGSLDPGMRRWSSISST